MTFDNLLDLQPNVMLADLIQLFFPIIFNGL